MSILVDVKVEIAEVFRRASLQRESEGLFGVRQQLAEPAILLQMPFAAHGVVTRRMALGIDENPRPPPCRTRACTGIVRGKTAIKIDRPSDIGPVGVLAGTAENIDEVFHQSAYSCTGHALLNLEADLGIAFMRLVRR